MERERSPRCSVLSDPGGVTLVEVLIAIVILTVGLMSVAMMQYMSVSGNAFGRELEIASKLGQELLERVRATDVKDDTGNIDPLFAPGLHPTADDDAALQNPVGSGIPGYDPVTRAGGISFTRIWWVVDDCRNIVINDPDPNTAVCDPPPEGTCAPGAGMNNIEAIAVRVCWTDKNGGTHSTTLNGVKWNEP